jgi:uncharacterized protein YaeQ
MALKSTIYKAVLQVSDIDRGHFGEHALTIARHPSETDERMMVRLLAFALHAGDPGETPQFCKGLSDEDEPDLWQKDLTGAIQLWIDVGQPDERRLRKACGRAGQVFVYCYGRQGASIWWKQIEDKLERLRNITVINLPAGVGPALAGLAERNMRLQCTIQEGHVWMSNSAETVQAELQVLRPLAA